MLQFNRMQADVYTLQMYETGQLLPEHQPRYTAASDPIAASGNPQKPKSIGVSQGTDESKTIN